MAALRVDCEICMLKADIRILTCGGRITPLCCGCFKSTGTPPGTVNAVQLGAPLCRLWLRHLEMANVHIIAVIQWIMSSYLANDKVVWY